MKVEAFLLARKHGFPAAQIRFSDKLEWVEHHGRMVLRKARIDTTTKTITLFTNAIEANFPGEHKERTLGMLKTCIRALGDGQWDEDEHPRDEDGKFTVSGGDGDSGDGFAGGLVMSEDKPATSSKPGKSKKPAKKEDFEKAKIKIGSANEAHVIEAWNAKIGIEPEEFKKIFTGGVNTTMSINLQGGSKFKISGDVLDKDGNTVGSFDRNIDPDSKSAYSAYFKLNRNSTKHNTGKKLLAGNVEPYEALGIEKLSVTANIDVGGYAWAKYGYVPTQTSWDSLRGDLKRKLTGSVSNGGNRGANTMEADDWSMLSEDVQEQVRNTWKNDTHSDFLDNEIQNWRDSGQALGDAKYELASRFVSAPSWATDAIDTTRKRREDKGEPPIPYTNDQLFSAINLEYSNDNGDGRSDPDVNFDDAYLKQPEGFDEAQGTLPGIEPLDPATFLTDEMRDQLKGDIVDAFTDQAESDAEDIDPPSNLADSVDEYQDEYWDSMDDSQRLEHARRYDLANIEIDPEEEDSNDDGMGLNPELFPPEKDSLLAAVQSSDPKGIWKVADSPRGKELLLGTGWSGVLNLKDPESMKRFNTYVGKAA